MSRQIVNFDTSVFREVVRNFPGHSGVINDMSMSGDSRWLVSVSMDGTGRVWDLPSGHCVDWVKFDSPPVSVDLSPTGK